MYILDTTCYIIKDFISDLHKKELAYQLPVLFDK
jgi:hypothetical protein